MNPYPIFTLGEVVEISNERIEPLASPQFSFNYVGLEHIESDTGQLLTRKRTLGSEIKSTKNSFKPNEILYGKLRPYLNKVHLAVEDGICSTDIFVLRPRLNSVSPAYVAYFLRSHDVVTQATNAMTGANLPRISQSAFQALPIPVPPLAEQERIVALLDEADALRKLRAQADHRTADLIPALFHDMFGDPATNPKGWPTVKLHEAGRLDRGRSKYRPRNDPRLFGGNYPFIQTGDIANSAGVISTFSQTYSEEGLKQSRLWPAGTLCITIAANIGKTAILSFPACFPDSIVGLTPGPNFTVEYLRQWFVAVQRQLEESAPQMAQRNINLRILASLDVPSPPLSAQETFASQAGEMGNLINSQAIGSVSVNTLFDSVLSCAFTEGL